MLQAEGSRHSYTDLFKLINAQSIYNEAEIKSTLKVKNDKTFKKLKHYTFQSILKSLENYFSASTDEIIVMRKLVQADILFGKKLFASSLKSVKSALALAKEKDLLFFISMCYERLYKLGVASARPQDSLKDIDPAAVERSVLDCSRWLRLKHLNTLFWNYIHTSAEAPTAKEKKLLQRIVRDTQQIFREGPAGYTLTRESYLLLGLGYRFSGQGEQSYVYRKKLVELIESENKYLYERKHEYLTSLGNLMNMCRELNKPEEMLTVLEKANGFMSSIPRKHYDFRLDATYCNLKNGYISFLFSRKKYADTIQYGEELLKRIKIHKGKFENSLMSILYQSMMYSHFFLGDYKAALKYHHLHLKRNTKNEMNRTLFGLIILFEMGDMDALHYRCRSVLYYIKKSGKQEAATFLAKAFTQLILKDESRKEISSRFRVLYAGMTRYRKQFEEIHKDYKFDYMEWVKNKSKL